MHRDPIFQQVVIPDFLSLQRSEKYAGKQNSKNRNIKNKNV